MSHTAVIKVCQLLHRLHLVVLLRMIKPARTDRHITLGSRPLIAVRMSVLQFLYLGYPLDKPLRHARKTSLSLRQIHSRYLPSGIRDRHPRIQQPAAETCQSFHRHAHSHSKSSGLWYGNLCSAIPAITAIGPVKPDFKHRTIMVSNSYNCR